MRSPEKTVLLPTGSHKAVYIAAHELADRVFALFEKWPQCDVETRAEHAVCDDLGHEGTMRRALMEVRKRWHFMCMSDVIAAD